MVAMILLALMFVVQVGLTYHARQVLAGAVQDGATSAAAKNSSATDGAQTARRLINGSAGNLLDDIEVTAGDDGERITVRAQASVVSLMPGFERTVSAEASASRERFRGQGG